MWPIQKDASRTVQTTARTLISLANNLERKVAAMSTRCFEVEVAIPCTLASLFPRGQELPSTGCGGCELNSGSPLATFNSLGNVLRNFCLVCTCKTKQKDFEGIKSISYGKPLAQEPLI